jgi:hypothetical protein
VRLSLLVAATPWSLIFDIFRRAAGASGWDVAVAAWLLVALQVLGLVFYLRGK